jgi:hypothetical protein
MDAAALSRREALEVTRGDEARQIQPRRFSIVLRKPLTARNDGGAPKSAFKSSKLMGGDDARRASVAKTPKGVTFMAPDAPDTPAARTIAVTHRRARMRTRKGTGRSVAARTFSLVLREPKEDPATETDAAAKAFPSADTVSDPSSAKLGSRDDASGVSAASGGESDSVAPPSGDDADTATVEIETGGVGFAPEIARSARRASVSDVAADEDDFGSGGHAGGFDDDDADFGHAGGFDDDDEPFGVTPARRVGVDVVDGGNDPMTGGFESRDGFGKRKRPPPRFGPRRPAGTPHKMERARMAKRQSLARAGAGLRDDLENEDGVPVRRSARARTRPLQYWRGETKIFERVHESLPTVAQMTHRTPNPAWPKNTPWHGGGAILQVGAPVAMDSAEHSRRAGAEARRRALRLADVALVSDSDDDVAEELPKAVEGEVTVPLDPFGFSK